MELVLAIDDDPAALAAVCRIVRDRRIRPLCLAAPHEALEIVRTQRPAVIVTVHRLGDTPDLLVEVLSHRPSARCVLHANSGGAGAERRFHLIEKGLPSPTSRAVVAALLQDDA